MTNYAGFDVDELRDLIIHKKRADLRRLLDVVGLAKADDIRRFILDYFALGAGA